MSLKKETLIINEIWPSTHNGIGVSWSANIGWGECVLYFDEKNNLHADTECMGKDFVKILFEKIIENNIIID